MRQRVLCLTLVDELNARIKISDAWLEQQAKRDERVTRLQTHPGIGLLTSLALVHSLEPVTRFGGSRKVAAYAGLEPIEYSSGDKQRFGSISKSGSRLLRYLLVEAAQITVKRDEALKRFYLRLLRRRGAQKAKVAVARKLLIRGFILLRDGIDYAEFLNRGVEARTSLHLPQHNQSHTFKETIMKKILELNAIAFLLCLFVDGQQTVNGQRGYDKKHDNPAPIISPSKLPQIDLARIAGADRLNSPDIGALLTAGADFRIADSSTFENAAQVIAPHTNRRCPNGKIVLSTKHRRLRLH